MLNPGTPRRCSTRELLAKLTAAVERLTARLDSTPAAAAQSRPVSFTEAAERLGVSVRHLERLAAAGAVKVARLGKRKILAAGECERLAAGV